MRFNPFRGDEPIEYKEEFIQPHQAAWLRRPELDRSGLEVWEMPCGKLHAHAPEDGPLVLQIIRT